MGVVANVSRRYAKKKLSVSLHVAMHPLIGGVGLRYTAVLYVCPGMRDSMRNRGVPSFRPMRGSRAHRLVDFFILYLIAPLLPYNSYEFSVPVTPV